jgi:Zn-dependent M16 (insulinase) family peptidase
VEKVVGLIDSTLQQAAKDGFDSERIESILHQLEISNKHVL